jgi:hypothetical protein
MVRTTNQQVARSGNQYLLSLLALATGGKQLLANHRQLHSSTQFSEMRVAQADGEMLQTSEPERRWPQRGPQPPCGHAPARRWHARPQQTVKTEQNDHSTTRRCSHGPRWMKQQLTRAVSSACSIRSDCDFSAEEDRPVSYWSKPRRRTA